MSKPFATSIVQNDVLTLQTTDGVSAQVILDQTLPLGNFNVQILTDAFNKGIRIKNDPLAFFEIEGGNAQINLANGNLAENTAQLFLLGAGNLDQNMLTVNNPITVSPANPLYNELNTTGAPGINVISRVNMVPDPLGTQINSIIIGSPNRDGREIWFQNLGTAVGQTLTFGNLSGAGTAGGLILAPGLVDFVIPPGGGASLMFDATASVDGLWLIRARA
jgi:hypothetical protein